MLWKIVRMTTGLAFLTGFLARPSTFLDAAENDQRLLTAASCEAFGFDFYRQLVSVDAYRVATDRNVALSPLSLAEVLEVLRVGATRNVEKELNAVLHATDPVGGDQPGIVKPGDLDSKGVTLSIGNSLWVDKQFEPKKEFLKNVDAEFGSVVFSIAFAQATESANRINAWIGDKTAGHIKDLLNSRDIPAATAMIIANAVYFKGQWKSPFDEKQTQDGPFHLTSEKELTVPMMHSRGSFRFALVNGINVLELPYAGDSVSMVLILPPSGPGELERTEGLLNGSWLRNSTGALKPTQVVVTMPRFTFSCEPEAIPVLKALGLNTMFQPSMDFEKISDKRPLYVGMFKHRAWLEVNEHGTEAAAATATGMVALAMPARPIEFTADRPFLFVIRHNATGTPLFIGRVSNPLVK